MSLVNNTCFCFIVFSLNDSPQNYSISSICLQRKTSIYELILPVFYLMTIYSSSLSFFSLYTHTRTHAPTILLLETKICVLRLSEAKANFYFHPHHRNCGNLPHWLYLSLALHIFIVAPYFTLYKISKLMKRHYYR